ncbi:transglycosylase SLT domain-containing protein [Streptomyces pinistramenti]|uniref:transglycosylase SLT domain-containing protein n=1 Tax=Streptomyces pinistramenti TaxID=2884812 RepID=UPI001D073D64|nr:transglycosylase SLT domain-containing protein [Streptomyces pinistramenti]MCB5907346.1 transglycosylase SLT domain-containing protein [Streptomyces pinistramenti]
MPKHAIPGLDRLTLTHKLSAAGVATAGAAALVFGLVPGADAGQSTDQASVQHTQPVTFRAVTTAAHTQQATIAQQADASTKAGRAEAAVAKKQAADAARAKAEKAAKERATTETASRSAARTMVPVAATTQVAKTLYPNNLDGWIRESLDIMAKKGIPGSYEGIHRNIIRESAGNPQAINNWDVNAVNGVPSKGLLQVIAPTFQAYHVDGTAWDIYDPVSNITAACNYAAAKYGSMDNVNSAY